MGLLDGKRLLITGVITDASIAFSIARIAQEQGATVVLTGYGRMSLVERVARKLPSPPPVVELDVADPAQLDSLADRLGEHLDGLDGVVHAIGFAPASCLGGGFLDAPWEDVATAVQVSTYSLKSLAVATLPLFGEAGGAILGMTFDATVAWPAYDWMGVAKAGLESASRYLARELGARKIRVNLVSAGPLRTMAAKSIPGFSQFEDAWSERAPLGWDNTDIEPVARSSVALLSDWFPATTGEIVHVDGGFHAMGV
ncbi:MAG: enoyl-[acyl-carrier-protein] reductase FabI [Jatrophihabitans sp.]|jgi:enoyl-[acyl-carrier protein] reductase I|nr:enoyl-[acyl-carrier-protein] reductase FabI [Jatrophihabitans sp.]MDT4905542.1 meromycolic acid enoyl-[acyl-carrier-protein] reductase [Pseudonocardiales bacterium]MDT4930158.1 meromycolic acid enoyl-[acyl-carrier-protein] reductase [Pseudonocardiales bacterium]